MFKDITSNISENTFKKLDLAQDGTWNLTYACDNSEAVTIPIICQSNHEWLVAENTSCPANSKNFTLHNTHKYSLYFQLGNNTAEENESKQEKETSTDKWASIRESNEMDVNSGGKHYLFIIVIPACVFLLVLLAVFAMIIIVLSCMQVSNAYN